MHTIVFVFCVWFLSKLWIGGSYDLPNKIFYKLEVNFTIEKYIVCIEPKIICSRILLFLSISIHNVEIWVLSVHIYHVYSYVLRYIYFYHILCFDDSTSRTWNNETGLSIFSGRRQISFCWSNQKIFFLTFMRVLCICIILACHIESLELTRSFFFSRILLSWKNLSMPLVHFVRYLKCKISTVIQFRL